jgi:hypothetical protein
MRATFSDLVLDVDVEPLENMAWLSKFWLSMLYLVNKVPRRMSRVMLNLTGKGRRPFILRL